MAHSTINRLVKESKVQQRRLNASLLIKDTVEQLKSRYESHNIDERILKAIAPLVENGEDPNVLLAREDFDFFCTQISSTFKPAPHHLVWTRNLVTNESNEYLHRIAGRATSILAPRGGAKSTRLGLFLAWAIGIHAEKKMALQTLYVSANRELALAKSETIRNLVGHTTYQKIFPFVQPNPKKWAAALWSIDREAAGIETVGEEEFSVIAAGILGTISSKRTHLICYDDLVKNAEDIASPAVRRKIVRTHYNVVAPTLFPGGRMLGINTRYRPDDIHVTDFIPSKGWNILEQSAIIPRKELIRLGTFKEGSLSSGMNTESLDEAEAIAIARQEEALLESRRKKEEEEDEKGNVSSVDGVIDYPEFWEKKDKDLYEQLVGLTEYGVDVAPVEAFESQEQWDEYLDEEVSYWENMWSLAYLKSRREADAASFVYQYQNKIQFAEGLGIPAEHIHYGSPPPTFDYFCIGGDLATSKTNKADYTVFTLVGKVDSHYWVLDYWRGKVTGNLQKIEHILDLYENWADDDSSGIFTPWRVAIEKIAYQASISDDLTRELYHKRTLTNIVVVPTQMRGGKEAHMASITGAFANGLVIFNEGIDWDVYVQELQGLGSHDDCVDSLAIALQTLGVRRRLSTPDSDPELLQLDDYQVDSSTWNGYWV